jgi:hypothetical protein
MVKVQLAHPSLLRRLFGRNGGSQAEIGVEMPLLAIDSKYLQVAAGQMNAAQYAAANPHLTLVKPVYGGGGFYLGAGHLGTAAGRMVVQGQTGANPIATSITMARRHARDMAIEEAALLGADTVLFSGPPISTVIMNNYAVLVDGTAFRRREDRDPEDKPMETVISTG